MSRTNTIRLVDVAQAVGVSSVAAGSVLLGSGKGSVRVGKATSEKIRRVAREMGYRPNTAARQLKGEKSKTIGVLIDSHAPVVTSERVAGIERACMQRGYRLIFGQAHNDLEVFKRYIDDFVSRGVEGLICASHDYEQADVIPNLLADIPCVLFLCRPKDLEACTYIEVDLADGIAQAVKHLVKKKKNRIGMISINPASRTTHQRIEGFNAAIEAKQIPRLNGQIEVLKSKDMREISTHEISEIVLKMVKIQNINSIICSNDIIAGHVIRACKQAEINVPKDLAVIGCDNSDFSVIIDPSLTTIDQNVKKFSQEAANMIFESIENGFEPVKESRGILIKPRLVVRGSA